VTNQITPGDGWMYSYLDNEGGVHHTPVIAWRHWQTEDRVSVSEPVIHHTRQGVIPVGNVVLPATGQGEGELLWHPRSGAQGRKAINNQMAAWAELKGVEI
jgi:hypothetical protein